MQSPSETTYSTGVGKPAEPLNIKVLTGSERVLPSAFLELSLPFGPPAAMGRRDRDAREGNMIIAEGEFMVFDRGTMKPAKLCATCGQKMTWRKKWEASWHEVKYCSDRCRSDGKRASRRPPSVETHAVTDATKAAAVLEPADAHRLGDSSRQPADWNRNSCS